MAQKTAVFPKHPSLPLITPHLLSLSSPYHHPQVLNVTLVFKHNSKASLVLMALEAESVVERVKT
jgi:hypothetical protein